MTAVIQRETPVLDAKAHSLADHELARIVSVLRGKYPERDPEQISVLVAEVYRSLAENATVTTHLIPLTINRCRRLLES
jgi:hypothetical protein